MNKHVQILFPEQKQQQVDYIEAWNWSFNQEHLKLIDKNCKTVAYLHFH